MNKSNSIFRTGIGQNSRRFLSEESSKPCTIGAVIFEDIPGLDSESDGDVILHAICNAITSLTGVHILGGIAKDLCRKDGITDSQVFVEKALETLGSQKIVHVAISIEGKRPYFLPRIPEMKHKLSAILKIQASAIGITATSGAGLTDFGCGDGLQCFCVITTQE
jgi:2-C-methyl-D-erythritol 2,4-cyclodiphosphate synthase